MIAFAHTYIKIRPAGVQISMHEIDQAVIGGFPPFFEKCSGGRLEKGGHKIIQEWDLY
jgi:hypothetical protein